MVTLLVVTPQNEQLEKQMTEIRKQHQEIFAEIILLSIADTLGFQLNETEPEEFDFRIQYFKNVLEKI